MTQDFERSKEVVCGRSVMITSWFDTDTSSWRSGAPTHQFINAATQADAKYSSRRSAIDRTVKLLFNRFMQEDADAPKPVNERETYWKRRL